MSIYSATKSGLEFSGSTAGSWTMGYDVSNNRFAISSSTALGTTDRLVINSSGNVGIGQTAPGSLLSVAGGISAGSYSAAAAPSNGMIISGNVGIGTTGPSFKLDINQSTTGLVPLRIKGLNGLTGIRYDTANTDSGAERNWFVGSNVISYGDFTFRQSNAQGGDPTTAGTDRLYIKNDGNVGIGNTAPLSKLGVTGSASIGATYGAIAAPTSGMIIEGNVGIGTTGPVSKLM